MVAFQEIRIQVEKKRTGDVIEFVKRYLPYGRITGIDVVSMDRVEPEPGAAMAAAQQAAVLEGPPALPPLKKKPGRPRKYPLLKPKGSAWDITNAQRRKKVRDPIIQAIKGGAKSRKAIEQALVGTDDERPPWTISRIIGMLKAEGKIKGVDGSYEMKGE